MELYINKSGKLEQIKDIGFKLEKEMQNLTENNLENIFGLECIKSEFSLNNLRIDTLAFDNENNSFVIIEFKKGSSYSVIDQGFTYLSMLLNNKANFSHELGRKRTQFIDMESIDWSQSKVIFIADSFTRYQKESINFKDLPIELYEMKQFNNGTIIYNSILATNTTESIKTITKLETEFKEINKEIKIYSIDEHFKDGWDLTKELYNNVKERILFLDSRMEEKSVSAYIGFKIGSKSVVNLKIQKLKIVLELLRVKPEDLKDLENKTTYIEGSMKWWNKDVTTYIINNIDDIDYGIMLTKQVLKKFFK